MNSPISDPNFPLVQLPATYESHRTTNRATLEEGQEYDLIDVDGPGCVRHFWITPSDPEGLDLAITCDGAAKPQAEMTMLQFFGVLLGKAPYRIESAAIKLLPKSGCNSYFPIPFQSSCRIVLRNTAPETIGIWSMVDWQKYDPRTILTPYRLHALFSEEKPGEALGTTLLGGIGGRGFVAGMFHAIRRHDYRDMIFHTGGDTWLIDGESNPHVLRGIGTEDVFGHSFGVYKDLSQWSGGPHAVGEDGECSEFVAYRFFGPDSVRFETSLSLRFGTRANDVENVLYYYKDLNTEAPAVECLSKWTLSGPFEVTDYEQFEDETLREDVAEGTVGECDLEGRRLAPVEMEPEHTWVDFTRWFRRDLEGNYGTQPDNCAAFARTVLASQEDRKVKLRLGFDDWMKIWLNGQPVARLKHDHGFEVSEVPVTLTKGDNVLVVRLSNFDNIEWRCWAFSCVIDEAEQRTGCSN